MAEQIGWVVARLCCEKLQSSHPEASGFRVAKTGNHGRHLACPRFVGLLLFASHEPRQEASFSSHFLVYQL